MTQPQKIVFLITINNSWHKTLHFTAKKYTKNKF